MANITNITKKYNSDDELYIQAQVDGIQFNNITGVDKSEEGVLGIAQPISRNNSIWVNPSNPWLKSTNAVDIDWNGAQLMNGKDVIATINTSGELISVLTEYQNIKKSNSTDTLYLLASTSSEGGYEKVYVPGSLTLKNGVLHINNKAVATTTDLSNVVSSLNNNMNVAHTELETSINAIDTEVKKIGSGKIEKTINVAYVAGDNYVGTDGHVDLVVSYANGNITDIKFDCPRGPLVSKDYVDYFIAEVREPQATETSYGTVKLFNGDVNDKDASYYTSYAIATGAGHKHGNYATKSDLSNAVTTLTNQMTDSLTGLQTEINAANSKVNNIGSGTITSYVNVAYIDETNDHIYYNGHIDLAVSYANGNLTSIKFQSHHGPIATQEYVDYVVGDAIESEATETSYGIVKLFKGDVDSQEASYYTSYAVAVGVAHTHGNYVTQDYVTNYVTTRLTNTVTTLQSEIDAANSKVNNIGSGTITSYVNIAYAVEANDYVGTDGHIDLVVSYADGNITNINFASTHGPIATQEYVDYVVGSAMELEATETSYGIVKLFNGNVNDKDASYYTSYAIATGAGHRHGNYEDKLNKLRNKINEIITYFGANITLIDEFNW